MTTVDFCSHQSLNILPIERETTPRRSQGARPGLVADQISIGLGLTESTPVDCVSVQSNSKNRRSATFFPHCSHLPRRCDRVVEGVMNLLATKGAQRWSGLSSYVILHVQGPLLQTFAFHSDCVRSFGASLLRYPPSKGECQRVGNHYFRSAPTRT